MIIQTDLSTARYIKSSYSNGSGDNCIEAAADPQIVALRDTKDRPKGTIRVAHNTFSAFAAAAAAGHLG